MPRSAQANRLIHLRILRHERLRILRRLIAETAAIGMFPFYILIHRAHLFLIRAQENPTPLARQKNPRRTILRPDKIS